MTKKVKMKKLYCVICRLAKPEGSWEVQKIWKLKIQYILEKTLVLAIIWSKCQNEDEKNI